MAFFFSASATSQISTLSLHDALPISDVEHGGLLACRIAWSSAGRRVLVSSQVSPTIRSQRSEEHTSELQSQFHLVCRLLLEKKNGAAGPFSICHEAESP